MVDLLARLKCNASVPAACPFPPAAYVHMPADSGMAPKVAENLAALRALGLPAAEIKVRPGCGPWGCASRIPESELGHRRGPLLLQGCGALLPPGCVCFSSLPILPDMSAAATARAAPSSCAPAAAGHGRAGNTPRAPAPLHLEAPALAPAPGQGMPAAEAPAPHGAHNPPPRRGAPALCGLLLPTTHRPMRQNAPAPPPPPPSRCRPGLCTLASLPTARTPSHGPSPLRCLASSSSWVW